MRYIIFPEGTRSRDGSLQRFKPGIGMLVAGTSVPVFPCAIVGAFDAWPAHEKRPRGGRVTLHVGAPICFDEVPNDRDGWNAVATRLQTAVAAVPQT